MAKKKYAIEWEDDTAVSFTVNGVTYASLDDIPNEADRLKLEAMMDSADNAEFEAEVDAEIAAARKELEQIKQVPVEKIVTSVFTGIAALVLLIAGISSVNNVLKVNREESAPGTVVDMTLRREYDATDSDRVVSEAYFPVVEFNSQDGKHHKAQLSEGSWPAAYEVGDEVTVLYDPEHPLDARIKSFASSMGMWILPGITGTLGIAFLGAVIAVRKWIPSEE